MTTTVIGQVIDTQGVAFPPLSVTIKRIGGVVGFGGNAIVPDVKTFTTGSFGLLTMPDLLPGQYEYTVSAPVNPNTSQTILQETQGRIPSDAGATLSLEAFLIGTVGVVDSSVLQQAIAVRDEVNDLIDQAVGGTDLGQSRNATSYTITSSTGSNTTLAAASTSLAGLMTSADKVKLNDVSSGVSEELTVLQDRFLSSENNQYWSDLADGFPAGSYTRPANTLYGTGNDWRVVVGENQRRGLFTRADRENWQGLINADVYEVEIDFTIEAGSATGMNIEMVWLVGAEQRQTVTSNIENALAGPVVVGQPMRANMHFIRRGNISSPVTGLILEVNAGKTSNSAAKTVRFHRIDVKIPSNYERLIAKTRVVGLTQFSPEFGSNVYLNDDAGYVAIDCADQSKSFIPNRFSASLPNQRIEGRQVVVGKTDGTANTLTIVPPFPMLINGAANYVLDQPYQHVRLICDGDAWFVVSA